MLSGNYILDEGCRDLCLVLFGVILFGYMMVEGVVLVIKVRILENMFSLKVWEVVFFSLCL